MNRFINDFKTFFLNTFAYHPKTNYNFTLSEFPNTNNSPEDDLKKPISNVLENNLNFMKVKYNSMISSDVIIREFTLNARNKQFAVFLFYIDGMVDQKLVNDFILNPLMLKNTANSFDGEQEKVVSEITNNNIRIRKVKKFNIINYIDECLLPQNSVEKDKDFDSIISGINSGNCALFVDSINIAFDIDVKGFKQRSVDSPNNEIVIKGPQEGFVENLRTNTSLIRRIVNNENLVIENIEVGKISKTKCAVCYMKNITNNNLVSEVKFRLNNLDIDSLLSTGELEQLITEDSKCGIPVLLSTERPDRATKHLFDGKVIIIVNGNPYVLIAPAVFMDFIASPEDTNLNPFFANFLKFIRGIAIFLTLLLPGIWVGVTNFHQELIPTELLFSIMASRANVPFPVIFEVVLMEISFELIREAGLRVPSPIGPTIRHCWCFSSWSSCCKCQHS